MSKPSYRGITLRHAPSSTKPFAHKTIVQSALEYADAVWDPHSAVDVSKLEAVQREVLRFVFNNKNTTFPVRYHHIQARLRSL